MKFRKNRKDPVMMEIRQILLGRTAQKPNGHLYMMEQSELRMGGAVDGEAKIRFLGISKKEFSYLTGDVKKKTVLKKAGDALGKLGRRVDLKSDREAEACLRKTYILYPVVLLFSWEEQGRLLLRTYTARSFSAPIAARLAVRRLEKELPESFLRDKGWKAGKKRGRDFEDGKTGIRERFFAWWRKRKNEDDDEVWNGSEWVKK